MLLIFEKIGDKHIVLNSSQKEIDMNNRVK